MIGSSAAREWSTLVATAVLGTDRKPLPPAEEGWDTWAANPDDAIALLDRAAAVVAAQRAGTRPAPPVPLAEPARDDPRPPCPPRCALRLNRILRGEHDDLLPEWLACCASAGVQLPWAALPVLLLRGRRNPELDLAVRDLAGDRARWLADAVPELGVRAVPVKSKTPVEPLRPPAPLSDSGAAVAAIIGAFADGAITWAATPQLRRVVAALAPEWLPPLVEELMRLPFDPKAERTRRELVALAEFRADMLCEFAGDSMSRVEPDLGTNSARS